MRRGALARLRLPLAAFVGLFPEPGHGSSAPVVMPFDEARPVVEALREALPAGLAGLPGDGLAAAWPGWVRERDRAVRERLLRGEEDAVVNLLFFGTSFTPAPRLAAEALLRAATADIERVFSRRLADLTAAIAGSHASTASSHRGTSAR